MRSKKLLSLTLAAAMVMAPMSVSATSMVSENSTASTDDSYTVSSSGSANAVSADHYKVVLPTDKAFDFVLDPQGLVGLSANTTTTLQKLEANAGTIKAVSTDAAKIQNMSSMPVVVSMNAQIRSLTDINPVASANDVESDTEPNMLLVVLPSQKDTMVSGNKYEPTKEGIVLNDLAGVEMDFYLEKGNWNVSANGMSYKDGGSGTEFKLGGLVNTKANWADVKETVIVDSVFNFAKASETPVYDTELGAFGLLSANGTRATSPVTKAVRTLIAGTSDGVLQFDSSLKDADGTYPIQSLLYVQDTKAIDTSAGVPSTLKAGDKYGGVDVITMNRSRYVWDKTTGKLTINDNIVSSLKTAKAHLILFGVGFDGSVVMSNEVVFE